MQAINSIDELDRSINSLSKIKGMVRLYNPEFSKSEQDHENLSRNNKNRKKELLDRISVNPMIQWAQI